MPHVLTQYLTRVPQYIFGCCSFNTFFVFYSLADSLINFPHIRVIIYTETGDGKLKSTVVYIHRFLLQIRLGHVQTSQDSISSLLLYLHHSRS